MACTGPLGCGMDVLEAGRLAADSTRGPFAAYPGLEKAAARVRVGSAIAGLS
jgi:hypothetical protein